MSLSLTEHLLRGLRSKTTTLRWINFLLETPSHVLTKNSNMQYFVKRYFYVFCRVLTRNLVIYFIVVLML